MDFVYFYVAIGFVLNTAIALWNYYAGRARGYIVIMDPFLYFLTIFSWPKTLFDLIAQFGKKDDDTDES